MQEAAIQTAALDLLERHGAQIMGTAKRYSLSAEDAEDAFQRGLEILLTKAPSTDEDDLVPWLKTVVKHEAFAIRKQRQRTELAGDRELRAGMAPAAHTQAERQERLRVGAEAISRLKPQEVRCLLLRAEGYSYKQICEETGWTYTKVNRCLAEGRKAFLERVAGIEAGAECDRLAPLLSRLADGEASAEDMTALRPHMRTCLSCRAALREYRGAPSRVAALLPVLAAPHLLGRLLHRLQVLFLRAHDSVAHAADVVSVQKMAAAAAATAALAGGGVATVASLPASHPKHSAHASRPAQRRDAGVRVAVKRSAQPPAATRHKVNPARSTADRRPAVLVAQQEFAPSPTRVAPTRAPQPKPAKATGDGEFGP
ncbi:MAG TPA: sigma-70 family RNA polymerase sigma factor [Thermoleophilaceae bacterium]|nr:sigma-70 family RNA polymerase sigma factor [Thermoleophilaceae bacterium]